MFIFRFPSARVPEVNCHKNRSYFQHSTTNLSKLNVFTYTGLAGVSNWLTKIFNQLNLNQMCSHVSELRICGKNKLYLRDEITLNPWQLYPALSGGTLPAKSPVKLKEFSGYLSKIN